VVLCEDGPIDGDLDPTTVCDDLDECVTDGPGDVACRPGTCANEYGTYACTCPHGYAGTGETACTSRSGGTDCADVLAGDAAAPDGVYFVDPDGAGEQVEPFEVYCDMARGGWTQVLDQDVAVAGGYLPADTWRAGVTTTAPNGGQWSVLPRVAALVGGEIFLARLTWDAAEDRSVEWRQWGDLLMVSANGATGEVMRPRAQLGAFGFFGLAPGGEQAAVSGDGDGNWSAGTAAPYLGGIQAFASSEEGALVAQRVRLYVRATRPVPIDCEDAMQEGAVDDGV
jgi:hypothetical protein